MTTAILSFTIAGRVTFRCDSLGIDDRRDLEPDPPFASWAQRYATANASRELLLDLGVDVGRWLDGEQHWLGRLIQATAPVVLEIETDPHPGPVERAALDAPWELVARVDPTAGVGTVAVAEDPVDGLRDVAATVTARPGAASPPTHEVQHARHLALDPGLLLTCVRRLGTSVTPRSASPYRLSVAFLAAQPDGLAGLDVDREEVAVRQATGTIGIDLAVEDSGNLERLGELVAQVGDCDVIHISCHGALSGEPTLALEGSLGERVDATAAQLSLGIGRKPRLAFLSACSTAGAGDALWSLSADLCRRGWPAVLGWSCRVSDRGAIELAAALYRQLTIRLPLVEAVAQARLGFALGPQGAEWHKARLFLGPAGGGAIVSGTRPQPIWPDVLGDPEFLDPRTRRIRVAGPDQPVVHRRALQRVLAALRDTRHPGVVIHGGDELARATLAARALRRLSRELPSVVVARDFDTPAILGALSAQTARAEVDRLAGRYRERVRSDPGQLLLALRGILEGPCRDPGGGALVLVLHGFDPVPDPGASPDHRRNLGPTQLVVARAVIGAFSGARTASRLLLTSAAPFSVVTDGGDLADTLFSQSLDMP